LKGEVESVSEGKVESVFVPLKSEEKVEEIKKKAT